MKPYRKEKIESLILKELSFLVEKDIEFENALVTLIKSELYEDLNEIKIYFNTYPKEKEIFCFDTLEKNKKFLEKKLFKKLKIKNIPKLKFLIFQEKNEK